MCRKFQLQVQTDLNALENVWQWFERITKPMLPEQVFSECKLLLTEGFTNAVCHAHKNLPDTTPISLEVTIMAQVIEIRIWDQGKPFDIEAKLKNLEKTEWQLLWGETGNGIKFMEKLTDELQYIRVSSEQNCLVMRKKIEYEMNY